MAVKTRSARARSKRSGAAARPARAGAAPLAAGQTIKIQVGLQRARADIVPSSWNGEDASFDVVFSTEAPVQKWIPGIGDCYEILDHSPSSVRMGFIKSGRAQFLLEHEQSIEAVAGRVASAKIESNRTASAHIVLSRRDDMAGVRQDFATGILQNISHGYDVYGYRDETLPGDKLRTLRAVDWEPREISVVCNPGDDGASVRSKDETARHACTIESKETNMAVKTKSKNAKNKAAQGAKGAAKTSLERSRAAAAAAARSAASEADDADPDPDPDDELETETETQDAELGTRSAGATSSAAQDDPADADELEEDDGDVDLELDELEVEGSSGQRSRAVLEQRSRRQAAEELAQARAGERMRIAKITKLGTRHRIDPKLVEKAIANGWSLTRTRLAYLEHLARKDDADMITGSRPEVGTEQRDKIRAGLEEALLHRCDGTRNKLTDLGRDFRGMSLLDMVRDDVERRGIKTRGRDRLWIATRAFETQSDIPFVVENVANKRLRAAYDSYPATWQSWTRQVPASDFKQMSVVTMGGAPSFKALNEHGEFNYGAMKDAAEKYAVATYGVIVAFTRQAIINDDLSALTRTAAAMGTSAAQLVTDLVFAILTANPNMQDGVALFASGHGNIGTGVISIAGLSSMRAAMRQQTGLNGQHINVEPRAIIVPTALETVGQQFTRLPVQPVQQSSTNPFQGNLECIAEPRLDASSALIWYGTTFPGIVDTIEVAFLEGQSGPFVETRLGWDVDGQEIKGRLDVGAKAIDWRGMYRSTGA